MSTGAKNSNLQTAHAVFGPIKKGDPQVGLSIIYYYGVCDWRCRVEEDRPCSLENNQPHIFQIKQLRSCTTRAMRDNYT